MRQGSEKLTLRPRHENMRDAQCMSFTAKGPSEILVAGLQPLMMTIDVDKGVVTKEVRGLQ